VEIDFSFEQLVKRRIQLLAQHLDIDQHRIAAAAESMTRSTFQVYKEDFGSEESAMISQIPIPIPGVPTTFDLSAADTIVRRGRLVISR
jgi:hypothetical protein